MPKVSVIIPTYNNARYLCEAIESVLRQTFKDYEIIVVDDGSTDDTKEKLERYLDKITYIFQNNSGPSCARNRGIKESRGDYIAFLDADDLWLEKKLEFQVEYFKKNKEVSLVTCDAESFDQNGIIIPSLSNERPLHSGWVLVFLLKENFLNTNNVLVKREVFESVGFFDESRKFSEDYDLWIRIAGHFKIGYVDKILTRYRIHNFNRSKINKELIYKAHLDLVNKYIQSNKITFFKKRTILAYNYFKIGYNYFDDLLMDKARNFFLYSLSANPFNMKCFVYLICTFFSKKIIILLKRVKRSL